MTDTNEKICFVIAPIGKPESETRKRSDQVLQHIIRPAVESCGYKAVRADEIDEPGIITNQIIRHVIDDPLVIADLTEQNANVFYELAIRHVTCKPLVQIINKVEDIPFDIRPMRTIQVNHQNPDRVEEAKTEIKRQIQSLEENPSSLENPISVALAGRSIPKQFDEINIEVKAEKSVETVTKLAEDAKSYVDEIERNRDKSDKLLRDLNAKTAADDPTRAKLAIEDVRENPKASSTAKAIAKAISLQEQGKEEGAIKTWRGIADAFEEVDRELAATAWFSVGYLLFQQKKPEDAIAVYDQAIRLKPDYAEAYNNRGIAKRTLERYEDAIADHDQAIRLKPDHAGAYTNRGIAKRTLGRYEDAIADYNQAIRLKPDYTDAYNNRGTAKAELERYEDAIADHDQAIRLDPNDAGAYNDRGIAKSKLGRYEDAIADFDQAIRLDLDYAGAYNNRGVAKSALDRIDEARQDFEKARDLARAAGDNSSVASAEQGLRDLDNREGE